MPTYTSPCKPEGPPDVITLVQQLHHRAQYIYCSGSQHGFTTTSNGIKQGCVIAPYLWNYFSLLFLSRLTAQRDEEWIRRVLTLFADDVWGAWVIRSELDLEQAVLDVSLILETLESLDMTINYTKTAILLRLVGRDASRLRRHHTYMKAGRLYLRVWVNGRECGIPIKEQHEYLGTIVTYRHRHQRNMQHRLQACASRYQGLRKLLNGSHHLTEQHRLRLWQACLTHVTTGDVWSRAGVPPGWTVQHTQQQFLAKLVYRESHAPDITTAPAAIAHVQGQADSLAATLLEAAEDLAKAPQAPPTVSCPFCQEVFVTENAMRVHCGIQHKSVPKHSTKTPTVFKPELHSKAGMPACQLCDRQFWRWAHLVSHIETGACRCLGGESDVRAPKSYDLAPAPVQLPPTANLGIFADENAQHTPFVQRPEFLNSLGRWEQWLGIPAVRLELAQHCVLCHFWVADYRHMKQHLNKAHLHDRPHLMPQAINMCDSFKSHLRRDSSCIWCSHKVGAPGRHVTQCTPFVQLCLAVAHCQDVHGSPRLPSQRRGGDICQLLAGPSRIPSQPESAQSRQPVAETPSPEPSVAVAKKPPQRMHAEHLDHLSANLYVLLLVQSAPPDPALSRSIPNPLLHSPRNVSHGCPTPEAHPPRGGSGLDILAAVPHESSALGTGGTSGSHATISEPNGRMHSRARSPSPASRSRTEDESAQQVLSCDPCSHPAGSIG